MCSEHLVIIWLILILCFVEATAESCICFAARWQAAAAAVLVVGIPLKPLGLQQHRRRQRSQGQDACGGHTSGEAL